MFEAITRKPKRRSSTMTAIISVSVAAHTALALGLIIVGMWQIERLVPPHKQLTMTMGVPNSLPKAEKPSVKVKPRPAVRPRVKIEVLAQPTDKPVETEPTPQGGHGNVAEEATGGEHGGGFVGPGTGGLLSGDGPVIPVIEIAPPRLETTVITKPPAEVRARVLEGKRVAGHAQIRPPESVRVALFRSQDRRIQGLVKMCLSERGAVSSLRMLKPTGYQAYDQKILSGMRSWRYQPYTINGQAAAVCTTVTFVYVMQD